MRASLLAAAAVGASAQYKLFGTGLSQGYATTTEQSLYYYEVSPGSSHGVITQWWLTGGPTTDNTIISFYIDGEVNASIVMQPYMAVGVGYNDDTLAPWANKWFGKQAKSGGFFSNFRIPFQTSVNVTYRLPSGGDGIYMMVRGAENLPIVVGGVTLPSTARMNLQVTSGTYPALAYIPIVDVPTGNGCLFSTTLSFSAGNLNTLEGCVHAYTPYTTPYPGTLISTGTEDYFLSAYYFNGGQFTNDDSGFTHINQTDSAVSFSAYRFHDGDAIFFSDGMQLVWRNGDASDPKTGQKCMIQSGGNTNGSPTAADVLIYSWFYTW